MRLRSVLVCAFASAVLSIGVVHADGMPGPEDNQSPEPSSAPPPYPPKPASSTVTPAPTVHPSSAAVTQPAPAPTPPPPPPSSAQTSTPPPAPGATPVPATPPAPAVTATNAASPAATAPASGQVAQKAIYEVTGIDVGVSKDKPSFVTVVVKGSSRTGGWTNAQLKPLQTFAPEVGMRSFTFVATPPAGASTQSTTPIQATIKIDPLPADVKTIRVLSETNEIAQTFR
jgi:hypothetical protein